MLQIPPQKLKEILIKDNLITAEKFEGLLLEAKRMDQNIVDFLISGNFVTADYFYNLAADISALNALIWPGGILKKIF